MMVIVGASVCSAVCVIAGIVVFIKVRYCKKKNPEATGNPPLDTAPGVPEGEKVEDESALESDIDKSTTPL